MPIERPRGAIVNRERRQKPLHPTHKAAQEATLTDGTFKETVKAKDEEVIVANDKVAEAPTLTPTPVPATPPNNLTANADQKAPADGTQGSTVVQPVKVDTLPLPKGG